MPPIPTGLDSSIQNESKTDRSPSCLDFKAAFGLAAEGLVLFADQIEEHMKSIQRSRARNRGHPKASQSNFTVALDIDPAALPTREWPHAHAGDGKALG